MLINLNRYNNYNILTKFFIYKIYKLLVIRYINKKYLIICKIFYKYIYQ